jgi:hypothetical protein
MRITRLGALGAAVAATLVFAAVALAVQTPIDDVELEAAGGDATFTYDDGDYACVDGTSSSDGGAQPFAVEDGANAGGGDALDGAMAVYVENSPFVDRDGQGDLTGQRLKVGPDKAGGLRVSQVHTALAGSQTLRALIKLKNTKKKTVKRRVLLSTEWGSDASTHVLDTSSGDRRFTKKDRWGVTSDSVGADDPGDPPVITVTHGKGQRALGPALQIGPFAADDDETIDGTDCANAFFDVRLKKRSTAYLLFFLELGDDNADALSNASKYNQRKLSADLKAGLSKGTQKKILNWDLGKKKGEKR